MQIIYICIFLGRGYTFTKFLKGLHITSLSFLAGTRCHSSENSISGHVRKAPCSHLLLHLTHFHSTSVRSGRNREGLTHSNRLHILLPPSEVTIRNQTLPTGFLPVLLSYFLHMTRLALTTHKWSLSEQTLKAILQKYF